MKMWANRIEKTHAVCLWLAIWGFFLGYADTDGDNLSICGGPLKIA
jgi:hypothetical protein